MIDIASRNALFSGSRAEGSKGCSQGTTHGSIHDIGNSKDRKALERLPDEKNVRDAEAWVPGTCLDRVVPRGTDIGLVFTVSPPDPLDGF